MSDNAYLEYIYLSIYEKTFEITIWNWKDVDFRIF